MGGLAWACGRLSGGGYDHGWAQMHVRINRPVSTRESAAIRVQLVTCLLPCGRGPAYCDIGNLRKAIFASFPVNLWCVNKA